MNAARILLVEDDPMIAELVTSALDPEKYRVSIAEDGPKGLSMAQHLLPDLIVLDVCLPKLDGLSVCRALRIVPELAVVPILFLSAKTFAEDKIAGFKAGADDYLCKPFNLDELELRIAALLRRSYQNSSQREVASHNFIQAFGVTNTIIPDSSTRYRKADRYLKVGSFTLDTVTYEINTPDRGKLRLTPVQFNLVRYLMSHPGKVFTTGILLTEVWGYPPGTGSPDLVRVHIKSVRQRIECDPRNPVFIRTVIGFGYMADTGCP